MITVKNLTNSPHELIGKDGKVMVSAYGEVTGEFDSDYVRLMVMCGSFEVSESKTPRQQKSKKTETKETVKKQEG